MSKLRRQMQTDLRIRNYAERTQATYIARVAGLEVPLEDLRDLVPRSLAHLLRDAELPLQRIQWTSRRAQPLPRHMRVDLRRPDRAVTQQRLDHP